MSLKLHSMRGQTDVMVLSYIGTFFHGIVALAALCESHLSVL